jgi:hypothetical protein
MPAAYQKSSPAAPAQPVAGEAFIPGLTPGVFSLESDKTLRPAGKGILHPDAVRSKHVLGQASRVEVPQLQALLACLERTPNDPACHERVDVVHDVPVSVSKNLKRWVGVDPHQALDLDDKTRLFLDLANDGGRYGFADLDGATGETPQAIIRTTL